VAGIAFLHFPADAVQTDFRRFGRLPASAQKVFAAVKAQGPLTASQLQAATAMPPRTVRYAVRRLREDGSLDTRCTLGDCRSCFFFVHKRCVGVAALEAARQASRQGPAIPGTIVPPAPLPGKADAGQGVAVARRRGFQV
jgi:DNA-binding transcriptional ArsR family regulator